MPEVKDLKIIKKFRLIGEEENDIGKKDKLE